MAKRILIFCFSLLLGSCATKTVQEHPEMLSMQTIDRNGFSETISSKDRLKRFSNSDFLSEQPYQKVLRVYPRDPSGQSHAYITSYHANGHPWQYLEVVEGRAHGVYKEWHPNNQLKIEAFVIEGLADVNEAAQTSWLFEGLSKVYNEEGCLAAEFSYEKGLLQGESIYYHPNGQIARKLFYKQNELEGSVEIFSNSGELLESTSYQRGEKHGYSKGKSADGSWSFEETYHEGKLLNSSYTHAILTNLPHVENGEGFQLCFKKDFPEFIVEIHEGIPSGLVRIFKNLGVLESLYHLKNGQKDGEEIVFYPTRLNSLLEIPKDKKLSLIWHADAIQGKVKTWYENGVLESEREMNDNKKHGLATGYYQDGNLMLVEEYDSEKLLKGSYYPRKEKRAISRVTEGEGIATLYYPDGKFKQKVSYEHGLPKAS